MSGGVSFGMAVVIFVPRHKCLQATQDIVTDIGIGIFIYHQTAGCMLYEEVKYPIMQSQLPYRLLGLEGDGHQGLVLGSRYFYIQGRS